MQMSATLIIIVLTCVISLIAFYQEGLMEDLALYPYEMKQRKQYYRFLTGGLVHGNFLHLFVNMYSLYFLGLWTEDILLQLRPMRYIFPIYYGLGIVVSGIPYYFRHRNNPYQMAVGASGAVSACNFTLVLISPWEKFYPFGIPMPLIMYAVIFLSISAYMANRGNGNGGGIAHGVHFWGAVYGFLFPMILEPGLLPRFLQLLMSPVFR